MSCELTDGTLDLVERIMRDAKTIIDSWQGEEYFIYLPTWTRYGEPESKCEDDRGDFRHHEEIVSIAESAGYRITDLTEAFALHPDTLLLWPFGISGFHYNEAGHRLVVEMVLEAILAEKAEN